MITIKSKNIDFYYFSGTGNTFLVVNKMKEVFQGKGYSVELKPIEKHDASAVNTKNTIGLAFPVAVFSTYNLVWDFIRNLPEVNGTEIFMVDTLAGYSGGIVGPLRTIVEKKGYTPIGAREIIMPGNIFFIAKDKENDKKVRKGLKHAKKYAKALIKGKAKWGKVAILPDIMNVVSRGGLWLTGVNLHQKYLKFKVKESKCSKCGLCVDLCPVSNIKMEEYLVTGNECEYCMRCVSFCPKKAIPCVFNYKGKTYSAVKARKLLKDD
ncbi:MAG: EFR1 family ferrodoxin [Methanobacteriaceae archaeon]|nr:EFR1 family ferrodoxin [Methanobacteriaceae archaeon]MDP3034467.1 EFR1 family ferrodoxin [Methanobacteriaceae archaeon]MDP3485143.1 EFR1 family ferrodoxin [Methanobacteriaceae archaeon]MDP3623705.1 EFR1 family ferrodoxin [Methanobacteriaceae archaeon]